MSGKSKEEIAFDILSKLKGVGVWGENNMQQILDMYAECLEATSGNRGGAAKPAIPAPARAPVQAQPAPPLQPQTQQPAVRQQQQMVQQAYQQPR